MSNKRISPEIRFRNYDEDWKRRNLGKVTLKIGSGKTPKGGSKTYVMNGIPFLRSQNIFNDKVNNNDIVYITEQVNSEMSNSEVKKNDVLLNITGASIGRSAVYNYNKRANVNQHVCIIRPKEGINSEFIQLNLSSYNGQKQVDLNQAGGGREGLNFKQIANMNFNFPSLEEQIKISNFLNTLSKTITLHQHELTLLKQRKKAFLQKMFPKKGESVPEIRFKGYHEKWRVQKVIDLANIYDNLRKPVSASKRISGETPYYGANGIQDYVEGYTHKGEFVLVAEDGANNLINYPVNYVNGKIWVNNHAHVLSGKEGIANNLFLAYRIKSMNISKYLVGGGRAKLNGSVLKEIKIKGATLQEQEKIGQFFKRLDENIALHEQKLEKLKKMKKAFLQKMFV